MLFANVMFYGLFVVLPGVLLIFGITMSWLSSTSKKLAAALGPGRWGPLQVILKLYLPLMPRAYLSSAAMALALRLTNDPVEGDAPLQPFIHSLDGILYFSAVMCLPFALSRLIAHWWAGRKSDAVEPVAPNF